MNEEALEHYRKRSRAPGVAAGGGPRNHYCLECNGVLPLAYDSRHPAAGPPEVCPHCGARLDPRVRAMFNWVETDQVPSSDLRALAPWFIGGFAVLAGGVWAVVHWLL